MKKVSPNKLTLKDKQAHKSKTGPTIFALHSQTNKNDCIFRFFRDFFYDEEGGIIPELP